MTKNGSTAVVLLVLTVATLACCFFVACAGMGLPQFGGVLRTEIRQRLEERNEFGDSLWGGLPTSYLHFSAWPR